VSQPDLAETPPDPPTTEPPSGGGGNGLTRVTFNALPATMAALQDVADITCLSRTDVLNRAVQVYQLVDELCRQPGGWVIVRPDGKIERIRLL
jgi:hypothetical protein